MKEQIPIGKRQSALGEAACPGEAEPSQAWRYVQHPESASMGDMLVPSTPDAAYGLTPPAAFIWTQLETPKTEEEMTAAFREKFGQQSIDEKTDLGEFLRLLTSRGLAIAIAPGTMVPPGTLRPARNMLSTAYMLQADGDWPSAIALCLEAEKDPTYTAAAKFNVLIGRYHTGQHDGLIQQARALSATLSGASRYACLALIFLAAHRTQQWPTARETALELAVRVRSPWDLPTVPLFAVVARRDVCISEQRSSQPILAVIDEFLAKCEVSDEERKSLNNLAQRYKQREEKSRQA